LLSFIAVFYEILHSNYEQDIDQFEIIEFQRMIIIVIGLEIVLVKKIKCTLYFI